MPEIHRRYRGERYRQSRRDEIIKKSIRVFAKRGYENTSMDEIAEKAKLAKGTLYYYFPSKEDLYQHVMAHTLRGIFDDLAQRLKGIDCPFRAFTTILEGMQSLFTKRPDLLKLFLPLMSGQDLPGQRRVEDLIREILAVHQPYMERYFRSFLDGKSQARIQVIRFLARSIVTNFLIQLRKGNTEHLRAFTSEFGDVLREGLGELVDCADENEEGEAEQGRIQEGGPAASADREEGRTQAGAPEPGTGPSPSGEEGSATAVDP